MTGIYSPDHVGEIREFSVRHTTGYYYVCSCGERGPTRWTLEAAGGSLDMHVLHHLNKQRAGACRHGLYHCNVCAAEARAARPVDAPF